MNVNLILALIDQHKALNCPGMVLPVEHVEQLVQAYRRLEQLRAAVPDALLAWEGHDRAKTRTFIESVRQ